jgi:hypothetical protein
MVVYVLYIKADLEGVASIALKPGCDICISVRNATEVTEVRERVIVDPSELEEPEVPAHERHHIEAPYHLALKWKHGEEARATVRILDPSTSEQPVATTKKLKKGNQHKQASGGVPLRAMNAEDSGHNFVPILALECHGLEPFVFHPQGNEFIVTNNAGIILEKDIDLSNGVWSHYDLASGSTSITNFEAKFE